MKEIVRSQETGSPVSDRMLAALEDVATKLIALADASDEVQRNNQSDLSTIPFALFDLKRSIGDLTRGAHLAEVAAFAMLSGNNFTPGVEAAIDGMVSIGRMLREAQITERDTPPGDMTGDNVALLVDPQYSPAQGQMFAQYQLNT